MFLQISSYPDLKLLRELTTTPGSGMHAAVVFSPDGKRLAYTPTGGDGTLMIVDPSRGKVMNQYAADFTCSNDLQFVDDRRVISHGWRRSPRIIDIETGAVTTLKDVVPFGGAGMAWTSRSGKHSLLLGHAGDERGQVSMWNFPAIATPENSKPAVAASTPPKPSATMTTDDAPREIPKVPALIEIPTEEVVKKAKNEIKQLLQIADDGPIDDGLPNRLLNLVAEEKDTTVHYAMLTTAARLAGRLGKAGEIRRALDELTQRYQFDRLRVAGRLLYDARTRPLASDAKLQLAALAEDLGDEAIATEEIDYASAFYDLAIEWSPLDRTSLRRRRDKGKQIDSILPEFRKAVAAQKLIDQIPPDPAAHQTWGSYRCFARGKWEAGLVHLSKAKDPELKDLTQSDLAVDDKPQSWLDLASRWKDYASKQPDGTAKQGANAAARYWYQRAIGKLTGLDKLRAETALNELPVASDHPPRTSSQ
ncbi:PD40 domain-containing protein [Planctomycetes bacterium K23_9]|uniref:WD domain, G-beta repeat n=1 Tax=Stieleria marina TaxID=1930275 RepID=A0A517NN32_9BACT|nr:hypothetical protein K239x_04760 [Planctomycetes bacterium K23_9]